jgi:hypothetical protein
MGGCNSVLNDIELAGAFIGAGVATVASGGAAAAGAVGAAGAAGAYFATKKGCSKDKTALVQATNEIVATAIILSVNECNSVETSSQDITITCDPLLPDEKTGQTWEVYEANPACGKCNEAVFKGMLAQHALERRMWDQGKEVKVRLPINEEYVLMLGRIGTCGINTCKACSLSNVTQSNILRGNSSCYIQMRSQANFKTNLTTLIQEQLVNNQDVLSGVAKAFGAEGVNNLTEKIVNQITSNTSENFLNLTVDNMTSSQVINMNIGGTTSVNNISQYSAFNIALDAVTKEDIVNKSISDAVFSTVAEVANEQNTLNDLGEVVFESTVDFTKAINNSVGKVMIAVLIGLGAVVAFIIGYALYKFFRKTTVSATNLAKKIEQQRSHLSAFEQF